ENPIELAEPALEALDLRGLERVEPRELDAAGILRALRAGGATIGRRLEQRVPRAAVGTLTLPLRLSPAAGIADVYHLRPSHDPSYYAIARRGQQTRRPTSPLPEPRSIADRERSRAHRESRPRLPKGRRRSRATTLPAKNPARFTTALAREWHTCAPTRDRRA